MSATWPVVPNSARSSDRDVATTSADDGVEAAAPAEAQSEPSDMPLVWPAREATEQASAAQPFESMPGVASLVIFLAAAGAFVAIAFRAVLLLWSSWFARDQRGPVARQAEPVIRRRASASSPPTQPAAGSDIETMTDPTVARLREIAKRWEAPARGPRQPRVLDDDETFGDSIEAPALRRRRVA
jgi:hypothetical protein